MASSGKKRNSSFLRSVVLYAAGSFGGKLVDVVSFSMLVVALNREELGFVGSCTLLGFFINDLLSLGIFRIAVPRLIVDPTQSPREISNSGLGFFLAYTAFMSVVLLLIVPYLAAEPLGLQHYRTAFQIYGVSFIVRSYAIMVLEVMRMHQRAGLQSFLEFLPSLLVLTSLYPLLHWMDNKNNAAALSQLIGWVPMSLYFLVRDLRTLRPSLDKVGILVRYSGPLMAHRTMSELNMNGSRWIVLLVLGLEPAGAFTFLSRLGDFMKLAIAPLQKAWLPMLLKGADAHDSRKTGQIAIMYLCAATAAYLFFLVAYQFGAGLIDREHKYAFVYPAIPLVAAGGWLSAFYMVFGAGFFVAKKSAAIIPLTTTAAALNLGLSFLISHYFRLIDVPYAVVISSGFFSWICHHYGRRYYEIKYKPLAWAAALNLFVGIGALALQQIWTR